MPAIHFAVHPLPVTVDELHERQVFHEYSSWSLNRSNSPTKTSFYLSFCFRLKEVAESKGRTEILRLGSDYYKSIRRQTRRSSKVISDNSSHNFVQQKIALIKRKRTVLLRKGFPLIPYFYLCLKRPFYCIQATRNEHQ